MKNILILIFKGMIIGVGQIIPGVSGGMLAISLGLYEKGVDAISNIFSDLKDNVKFLCSVGFGVVISVIIFSKIIKYLLINFYLHTMLLFIGLIFGTYKLAMFGLILFFSITSFYDSHTVINIKC